jgi:hypothetical protein
VQFAVPSRSAGYKPIDSVFSRVLDIVDAHTLAPFSVRFSVKRSSVSCFSKSKNKALCSFHKEVPAPFRIQKLLDGCSPTSFPGSADAKRSPVFQKVNLLMAAVVRLRLRFSLLGLHSRASQFAPPQPLSAPWSLFE